MTRAFVPVIGCNGGGHVPNVASALSRVALGGSCGASKAAPWSRTDSLRLDLRPRGVAEPAVAGIEADAFEVPADDATRHVKSAPARDLAAQ
ncbi:hypothetical protein ACIGNX_18670 [Actinosynnema sp. NPDC053489]|uniref:hypothetical protein n=1 Tax=Actinosynnema sp. NPDC053489 TaxID=3363916 RepID=UPI0037C5D723